MCSTCPKPNARESGVIVLRAILLGFLKGGRVVRICGGGCGKEKSCQTVFYTVLSYRRCEHFGTQWSGLNLGHIMAISGSVACEYFVPLPLRIPPNNLEF